MSIQPPPNTGTIPACRVCGGQRMGGVLDLGPQPIANRFKPSAAEPDYRHDLKLTQCQSCGLVQLVTPFPGDELRPRLEWIRYREREDHLDEAMGSFAPFFRELPECARVFGLTDFDRVLFQAFQKQQPGSDFVQITAQDLAIPHRQFGMETIQLALTPACARQLVEKTESAQVMVTRYLFEHAADTLSLLTAYRELIVDDGFLLVEVPDSTLPLQLCDYPMIWEEHVSYFTESTLRSTLENNGFTVCSVFKTASKFESPLIALARKTRKKSVPMEDLEPELQRFENYRASFSPQRDKFQTFCRKQQKTGRKVFLFGAGHFSVAFANFMGLENILAGVIDDDPNKAGKFLAGTSLPIISSKELQQNGPHALLLCVNPDVEMKVMEKIRSFSRDGDGLFSIFNASPYFCLNE